MIVVGLMSGTSMDGIDVATADLALDGDTLMLRPLGHETVPYDPDVRAALAAALPPAGTTLEAVCRLDSVIGQAFAAAGGPAVERFGADLVVSHGQTVFHWVDAGTVRGTLQIGQPAWIAEATGLPVVSDLRSADVAAGGQGAPLVSLFDVLLLAGDAACDTHDGHTRAALNLGGIANLTVLPPAADPFAFDAGPANALIDAATGRASGDGEHCDENGHRAARGSPHPGLLAVLDDDPYYRRPPPKTTGKEHFNSAYLDAAVARAGAGELPGDDLVATVTVHAAGVVAAECARHGIAEVVASGGGVRNPALMRALAEGAPGTRLVTIDEYGIPSDAKEAYAFAVLGFLTVHGLAGTVPSCTGARHPSVLGRVTPGRRPWPASGAPFRAPIRLRVVAADRLPSGSIPRPAE